MKGDISKNKDLLLCCCCVMYLLQISVNWGVIHQRALLSVYLKYWGSESLCIRGEELLIWRSIIAQGFPTKMKLITHSLTQKHCSIFKEGYSFCHIEFRIFSFVNSVNSMSKSAGSSATATKHGWESDLSVIPCLSISWNLSTDSSGHHAHAYSFTSQFYK